MSSRSKQFFSEKEIAILIDNPNVSSIKQGRYIQINYTEDFKQRFLSEIKYKGPAQIFAEAGLSASLIGYKRIERATYRWTGRGKKR